MEITFHISPDFSTLESVGQKFGIEAEAGQLEFPAMLGQGYMKEVMLSGGWRLMQYDFCVQQGLTIRTINPPESGLYNLIINPKGISLTKHFEGQSVSLGTQDSGGIFFQSPGTPAIMHFQAGVRYQFANLLFTKDSLSPYFDAQHPIWPNLLDKTGLYLFEEYDVPSENLAFQLLREHPEQASNLILLHSHILQLLNYFFTQYLDRDQEKNNRPLAEADLAGLMKVRTRLKQNLETKAPTIDELAQLAGMSESKLKRQFKTLFGKTLGQYARYVRMLHAQRLFHRKRYNISEVAAAVGYSNLTHFGKAFEDQFGLKPRDMIGK